MVEPNMEVKYDVFGSFSVQVIIKRNFRTLQRFEKFSPFLTI